MHCLILRTTIQSPVTVGDTQNKRIQLGVFGKLQRRVLQRTPNGVVLDVKNRNVVASM